MPGHFPSPAVSLSGKLKQACVFGSVKYLPHVRFLDLTNRTSDELFPFRSHSTLRFSRHIDLNIHTPSLMRAASNVVLAKSFGLNVTLNIIYSA